MWNNGSKKIIAVNWCKRYAVLCIFNESWINIYRHYPNRAVTYVTYVYKLPLSKGPLKRSYLYYYFSKVIIFYMELFLTSIIKKLNCLWEIEENIFLLVKDTIWILFAKNENQQQEMISFLKFYDTRLSYVMYIFCYLVWYLL